jgi:hypothetical protein
MPKATSPAILDPSFRPTFNVQQPTNGTSILMRFRHLGMIATAVLLAAQKEMRFVIV